MVPSSNVQPNVIKGTFIDCNNNPITDGYVELNYNTVHYVNNGDFEINTLICNLNTGIVVENIDFSITQTTGVIPFILSPRTTSLSNIISFNIVDDYITYQVGSVPVVVPILVCSFSSNGFIISYQTLIGSFLFVIDTTNIETYALSDFNLRLFITAFNLDTSNATKPQNFQFIVINFGKVVGFIDVTFLEIMKTLMVLKDQL